MSRPPFHLQQITRTLPAWSKALHRDHATRIMQSLKKDYLDADGVAYEWYSSAEDLTRQALLGAIAVRDASRKALHDALAPLQGMTEFCTPLLQKRLALDVSVDQAQYVYQRVKVKHGVTVPNTPPPLFQPGDIEPDGDPQLRSLLEAALHNFEGTTDTTTLSRLQTSAQNTQPLEGLTLADFIDHCRELDLGKRYQVHLAEVFEGENKSALRALAIKARQDEFRVQARIASCKNNLSPMASMALHDLCSDTATVAYNGRPLECSQVQLLNVPIHEVLFIAPAVNGEHDPVFLYNPIDDDPIQEFASLGLARKYLREKLVATDYRNRFVALAPQQQQAELKLRLRRALFSNADQADALLEPRSSIHLESIFTPLPGKPWAKLEANHLVRLKSDARWIAVPTADVDANVRLKNLEYWFDMGMTVFNIAAMFVPGLNTLMLTLGAAQIMGSVFHGIEAWEAGDNAEALAQLQSILVNVAVVGAIGVGASVLRSSGFVDGMRSILKDGREYLWSPTLKGYDTLQSIPEHLEADSQGRYTVENQKFIRMDSKLYEQVEDTNHWRLAHPQDPQAYRPEMLDNGEGAWRAVHEQPLLWEEPQLLKRLGPISNGLADADLDAALQCSGVQGDVLRYTQSAALQPPALLADILDRLRCDQQADDIIDRVRNGKPLAAYKNFALPSVTELEGWPEDHVIKAYHGPESWGDYAIYGPSEAEYTVEIEVNRGELEQGQLSDRIVEQLEEDAMNGLLPEGTPAAERAKTLSNKLAQHLENNRQALFERLYTYRPPKLSAEAQTLANQFKGLPPRAVEQIMARASASERQRLASGRVPLRIAEEARVLQAQARLGKALLGLYRPGLANADSALLDARLTTEHPLSTANQRFQLAVADRAKAATLIGQQPIRPGYRSPMHLAGGRLGYPLSGRLNWISTAGSRLRELYPNLSREQRNALLGQLRLRGDVAPQLRALELERNTLDRALQDWEKQAPVDQQAARRHARELINGAWRRDQPDTLTIDALQVDTLPSLPARFDHITSMQLRNLGLTQLPESFFQSFPQLQTLRLAQNPEMDFDSLFRALRFTPELQTLELGNNRIGIFSDVMREHLAGLGRLRRLSLRRNDLRLTEADLNTLKQLPLEALDLENNRIHLNADLASHFNGLIKLQDLRLTNNPLQHGPDLTGLTQLRNLQLRNCYLQDWPQGLTQRMSQPDLKLNNLDLSANPIREVPDLDQVLASPFANALRRTSNRAYWEFNENDLEAATNQRLRAVGARIARREMDIEGNRWLQDASEARLQLWEDMFETHEYPHLEWAIRRSGDTLQATANPRGMAQQVWQLLTQASQDQALREHLESVAAEFPATCEDAGADALSTLEVEALSYRELAEDSNITPYLFNFMRKLYRRDRVNYLAERIQLNRLERQSQLQAPGETADATNLPALDTLDDITDEALLAGGVDLIEMRLALRQALAEVLDFPEPSQGMMYRETAQISTTVEFNVEQAVTALDRAPIKRRGWIALQPAWQRLLKQRFTSRFSTLEERWLAGYDYLQYCLDAGSDSVTALDEVVVTALTEHLPESPLDAGGQLRRVSLNSHQYNEAAKSLKSGLEQQQNALYKTLTDEQDSNS
ncbi:dermonecrotic toxin domain-containing protein [Pseudomonas sp. PSKL.D1]|uniref:dermonecrotic toxin domain-containing protein n=1 Tax=Pseudomonas sp. PSKL.D1 TaxID=3029060 RepID=UPI0023816BD5|nr:DUF6543 domain-containing protein [Pseudomonas sp. PSKL.D1]WDY55750.1 NEL-type E3 ubiquitin ligase domain-containing protein [Pseudomonas sp. PSKL.D1]